jgi:transcriptional regulator with XRE-family HTH domain
MHPDDSLPDDTLGERVRGGVSNFAPAKLRAIRSRAGVTLDQVAAALNVSSSSVRKWEAGLSNPRPQHLAALAALFARPSEEFLRATAKPTLRQLREAAGLTMSMAAEAVGTSSSTINRLEQASQHPNAAATNALAVAYGVTPGEIDAAWRYTAVHAREETIRRARNG